jgi:predicted transcriptional regulator
MKNTEVAGPISFDDIADALADAQRRELLVALVEQSPRDDSPVVVAGSENDADGVGRPVAMKHIHLPKLADYGFIDRDEETREVSRGPNFGAIRPLLELLEDHEDELPEDWV